MLVVKAAGIAVVGTTMPPAVAIANIIAGMVVVSCCGAGGSHDSDSDNFGDINRLMVS